MSEVPNKARAEYVALWDAVLSSIDGDLPRLLESGLATQSSKIDMDALDGTTKQFHTIIEMRKELQKLDEEYAQELAALASVEDAENTKPESQRLQITEPDDRVTRIADFLQGLVVSVGADIETSLDLKHILQQIYLFQTSNEA